MTDATTLISNQIWLVFMLDSIFRRRSGAYFIINILDPIDPNPSKYILDLTQHLVNECIIHCSLSLCSIGVGFKWISNFQHLVLIRKMNNKTMLGVKPTNIKWT